MKRIFIGVMMLAAVLSIYNFSAQAQAVKASDIMEITLEDDGGFGFERGNKAVLHQDGSAEYTSGKNNFNLKGKYRGRFDQRQFAQLAALLVKQKFFTLKDRYESQRLDAATVTIGVAFGGQRRKTVQDQGQGGGRKLVKLERAIEAVVDTIKWQPVID